MNCFRALNEQDYLDGGSGPSKSDDSLTIVEIESIPWVTDTSTSTSNEVSIVNDFDYIEVTKHLRFNSCLSPKLMGAKSRRQHA